MKNIKKLLIILISSAASIFLVGETEIAQAKEKVLVVGPLVSAPQGWLNLEFAKFDG